MAIPIQLKRVFTLLRMIVVFGAGLAAPATQADPPIPTKEKPKPHTDRYGDLLPAGALARLGTVRLRPGGAVRFLACLPDRKSFVSVAAIEDASLVTVWRMATGELLHRFQVPLRLWPFAKTVDLSPDGKTLAATGYNRADGAYRVQLWDVASGKKTGEFTDMRGEVVALAFSPDAKTLATAGKDQTLRLWDVATRTELRRFEGAENRWERLVFTSDGKTLVANGRNCMAVLWDTATGKLRKSIELGPGAQRAAAFSPDGKMLATTGRVGINLHLWDLAAGKMVQEIATKGPTISLAFSPDGKMLAAAEVNLESKALSRNVIHLWDASTGRELHRLDGPFSYPSSLAFSLDGKRLVSSSWESALRLHDTATGKDLLPFAENEGSVNSVVFSPDGRFLAAAGMDGTIRLWQPSGGKPARLFEQKHQQRVWNIVFTPDGQTLISFSFDKSVRHWKAAEGRQTRQWMVPNDAPLNFPEAFSPDTRTFAVQRKDGFIGLFDAATGKEQRRMTPAISPDSLLLYSPDGKVLAAMGISATSESNELRLWDAVTGKELRKWTVNSGPMTFSPDGRTIFGVDGGFSPPRMDQRNLQQWDVASGAHHSYRVAQTARMSSVAASPDGRMLAWGDAEGTITLWELAARQVRRRLKGHHSYVLSLVFSADGKRLASGSSDTTALLWDVTGRLDGSPAALIRGERYEALWAELAGKDAAKAFDAMGRLTASPEQAIPLLKRKLPPAPKPAEGPLMARLIADLDSDDFAVREKAKEQMRQLGERAEPGLREALKNKLPLETRKRIEELMEELTALSVAPDRLRELRAVEVLEHIGTAVARQVLRELAEGAAHARLTHEAKASLQRLDKQSSRKP